MTWKIKVTHIDDKTGACVASEATLTDIVVAESTGEVLDYAQQQMTHEIKKSRSKAKGEEHMNERITEIVIDLLGKEGVVNSRGSGNWVLSDDELEKFAELIVKECAELIETQHTWITSVAASALVRKHFGVKE